MKKFTHLWLDDNGIAAFNAPNYEDYYCEPNGHEEYQQALKQALAEGVYFKPDGIPAEFKAELMSWMKKGEIRPIPDGYEVKVEQEVADDIFQPSFNIKNGLKEYAILVPKEIEPKIKVGDIVYWYGCPSKVTKWYVLEIRNTFVEICPYTQRLNPIRAQSTTVDELSLVPNVKSDEEQIELLKSNTPIGYTSTDSRQSIEEAADKYVKLQGHHDKPEITKHDFIAGAKSQAAKEYWCNQLIALVEKHSNLLSIREIEQFKREQQ